MIEESRLLDRSGVRLRSKEERTGGSFLEAY